MFTFAIKIKSKLIVIFNRVIPDMNGVYKNMGFGEAL